MTSAIFRYRQLARPCLYTGASMQRIDGAYVYELGAKLRPILSIIEEHTTRIKLYYIVGPAIEAIEGFLHSVYIYQARTVHSSARALLDELKSINTDFSDFSSFELSVSQWDISSLKEKFKAFEAILIAELQSFPLYLVHAKGGFDIVCLTDAGLSLFPSSLPAKCQEAVDDIMMGSRSLAFELWTASAFHFHRANEAVLRRYYDSVIGGRRRPKILTMGTMVSSMDQHDVGDLNIRAALKNIINFHRNPIAHPDHKIADSDEAISLYSAVRACMGYMLDKLPSAKLASPAAIPAASATPLISADP